MASIDISGGRFVAKCKFEEKNIVKAAGFEWDRDNREWWTLSVDIAAAVPGATWTERAFAFGQAEMERDDETFHASFKASTDFEPPVPAGSALAYLDYQKAGVEFAWGRYDTLIADQPGLGKTIQAVGVFNMAIVHEGASQMLVVCPASLKENWKREIDKWKVKRDITVGIAETSYVEKVQVGVYKNGKPKFKNVTHATVWPDTDVVIINYDILGRFHQEIHGRDWDLLVCDECHRLKTLGTKRTMIVFGGEEGRGKNKVVYNPIWANRRVFLSGTPMTNRPIELYPLVAAFDPANLGKDYNRFVYRYCAAQIRYNRLDVSGASNAIELGRRLRSTFMIRRMKREVLPQLPPVRRSIVLLNSPELRRLVAREDEIAQGLRLYEANLKEQAGGAIYDHADRLNLVAADTVEGFDIRELDLDYASAVAGLSKPVVSVMFEELAAVRREIGIAKLPAATEWITDFLEGGEKLILSAYHTDVVEELAHRLHNWKPAVLYGKTPAKHRQAQVDQFQEDEDCRAIIGNIDTMSEGHTMTRAHDGALVEGDWRPTKIEQLWDRMCRIGQTSSRINGYSLVADGSMDSSMAIRSKEKEDVIEMVMG